MNAAPTTNRPTIAAPVGHLPGQSRRSVGATGGVLAALALGATAFKVGRGASRADAQSTPQPVDFPPISLTYSDTHGPGQATITPQGPDEATDGIVIALTIAQPTRTLAGSGFVRQIGPRSYVIASAVTGAIALIALPEGETRFELQLAGLAPAAGYGIRLHAGSAAQLSASFTQLATVTAGAAGRANANGLVRFRGSDPVTLLDIAGGGHVVAGLGPSGTVATGAIPALQPLG